MSGGYDVWTGCGAELIVAASPLLLTHVTVCPALIVREVGENPFAVNVTVFWDCCAGSGADWLELYPPFFAKKK